MFSAQSDILNAFGFIICLDLKIKHTIFFCLLESKNPKHFGFFNLGFALIVALVYELYVFQENGTKGTL